MAKNRILISALVAVLLGFGFYMLALKPKQQEAADLETQVATAQADLDAAQALVNSGLQAKRSFRRSYATVVRLGKAVPGDDDVRSLVVQLDQAAKRTGVSFESINVGGASGAPATDPAATPGASLPPGATVGPAGFPIMPFTFEFKGQFFKLGSFFERLDRFVEASNDRLAVNGRLLTVDALKLAPDTSGFPNIRATVTATAYLVSPLEGATGGASPAGPEALTAGTAPTPIDPSTATAAAAASEDVS